MAIWIHGNDLLLVVPLRERSNAGSGLSVGEIGLVRDVELTASDSKRVVDRIRASVSSNCCTKSVKSLQNGYCCHYEHTITSTDSVIMPRHNNRTTNGRVFGAPLHRQGVNARLTGVRSQDDF
jgi:hypothetical protein